VAVTPPRRPAPEPLETDDVTVVVVGTALWLVGLVVTLVLHDRLDRSGRGDWVWIMCAGVLLGLLGLRHVRRRRSALARLAETDPSAPASGPNTT
jgi:hypothetical protein